MNDKIQFNVRIRPQYARAANIAAALMDAKNDTVVEMAIRVLLGVDDAETVEKRNRVREAWAKMGEKLPSAAIAVGFATMASGCSERDNGGFSGKPGVGGVAHLVERRNGIAKVGDSISPASTPGLSKGTCDGVDVLPVMPGPIGVQDVRRGRLRRRATHDA